MTNFRLAWPYRHAASIIAAWQGWAPTGPDELGADLVLSSTNAATDPEVAVCGALIGTKRDASELLGELTVRAGADPTSEFCQELSYRETIRYQAELSVTYDVVEETPRGRLSRQGHRFTKSDFFARPLPDQPLAALVDRLARPRASGQSRSLTFAPWGGAYNRRSPLATAFAHRDQLFSLEHTVVVDPSAPASEKSAAQEWVTRSWASVHSWASGGVYPNFSDPDLDDAGRAYHGGNYPRLLKIKANYDPNNLFRFKESVPIHGIRSGVAPYDATKDSDSRVDDGST